MSANLSLITSFESKSARLEETPGSKEFIEKMRGLNARVNQLAQIFQTYIYFYYQVVREKTANLQDQTDKLNESLRKQMTIGLERLKEKRVEVSHIQTQYFENCSLYNTELKSYLNYEQGTNKPQVSLLKQTKHIAENKYQAAYVGLLARVPKSMERAKLRV